MKLLCVWWTVGSWMFFFAGRANDDEINGIEELN
jgi:hypothetical protein